MGLQTPFLIKCYYRAFFNVRDKPTAFISRWQIVRGYNRSAIKQFSRPDIKKQLMMQSLPDYYTIPNDIIEIQSGKIPTTNPLQEKLTGWVTNKSTMRENESNYIESFRAMIHLEEAAERIELEKCNQENVKLHHIHDNEFYFLVKPEMKSLYALIKQFDKLNVLSKDGSLLSEGQIIFKESGKIIVELECIQKWQKDQLYDIVFPSNRTFYLLQHQALNFVRSHKLFDLLINNPSYSLSGKESESNSGKRCNKFVCEELNDLNDEQKEAIKNIMDGAYYPLPYLLYGPPGTGKTKTLVASILGILHTSNNNILVCAQSNAACDELTIRLSEFLDQSVMFRLNSKSNDVEAIATSVIKFSNYFGTELKYPRLRYIYQYRVVICTLATAGCLTRGQCNPDHFAYVFIDECASALETMALVPIAGLCTTEGKIHGRIVLAGDPKQLDAVTKSEWANKLGYGTSFLEQLFNYPLYQRDSDSGKFNAKYITQLVKNYRSHPAILHVPNKLFYEGALRAETSPQISNLNVTLPDLKPDFPIIFKSVQGICLQPEDDTSSYNVEEIVEVMSFMRNLLDNAHHLKPSDIGIISPYRLQCEFLQLTCKRNGFHDVTVGTAEKFQGQERKIIIASTVSSGKESLGSFVSDPQRFNVMVTRAQYLLIIVGDPHTLSTNRNWYEFIKYCYKNGALIQSDNHFTLEEKDDMNEEAHTKYRHF